MVSENLLPVTGMSILCAVAAAAVSAAVIPEIIFIAYLHPGIILATEAAVAAGAHKILVPGIGSKFPPTTPRHTCPRAQHEHSFLPVDLISTAVRIHFVHGSSMYLRGIRVIVQTAHVLQTY